MKLFISADIEGVAGIAHWEEANSSHPLYPRFADQMTREVAAVCEGAVAAGARDILVKDAHGAGRNLDPSGLPEQARVLRSWPRHPYSMVSGLDASFDGILFVGYHAAAGTGGNPLAHTISSADIAHIRINGELASEFRMNAYTAAMLGVPVLFVSGDRMLCEEARDLVPGLATVAVSEGLGGASTSIHPRLAVSTLRAKALEALQGDLSRGRLPLPDQFRIEVRFKQHPRAYAGQFYPGARQLDAHTVGFETRDYFEALRFFFFVL